MKKKFFGTDGVRGRVGSPPMTPDVLVRLGFAAGKVLGAAHDAPQVLVAKDTRLSGYMVESALEAGLAAAGADVLLSGPLPTSGAAYLTQTLRLAAGVVISASHNPHDDNGVKFFGSDGRKLPDAVEEKIEREMNGGDLSFKGSPGRARRLDAAADRYIEFCKRSFPASMSLRGMRVLADCANGAAYHVAPPVLHELGAEVEAMGDQPDGVNINVDCGVMNPKPAARRTKQSGAAAGVILDGDADRIFMADEKGRIYDGDALLYLIAKWRCEQGDTPKGVVGTHMSNMALERAVRDMGAEFVRADVGDRHVLEALDKRGWTLGGEASGHVVLRDLHCTGDGIITALQVLAAMCQSGQRLSELMSGWRPRPQVQKSVRVASRRRALESSGARRAIKAMEKKLGGDGRIVVRSSGTEELIRVMAESPRARDAKDAADAISKALLAA